MLVTIVGTNRNVFFYHGATTPSEPRHPHFRGFMITDISHSVGFLWTSDQPGVETFTWQHTTLTRERLAYSWRDSHPQSQKASGRRFKP